MATDRVKGITIEIDGDTKGLSQALKGVNKDIKSTQTQLKDVEKLLKLDPHNVTLLGQKMKLLGNEINQTKDKLSQLKSVQEQMEEGLKNGTVSAEQYDAWQREIIETENELKNLESQLAKVPTASEAMLARASEHMDAFGQKVSAVGDKISAVGDALMPVTAGITALGTASVKAWQEQDEALDNVIAKTGATGEQLEAMQGIINSLATSIPSDFKTVSNAVAEVNTRFGATGQELENLSALFIKFSTLNNTDVTGSIDSVSAMMKAWGINASQTESVLNTLNAVGQNTGASVSELASLLQTNALSFKEMGYNVAEASVLLGQLEKNGVDASTGVTALRKAFATAIDEGKPLNEVLAEWESLMASGASETEKLARTEELFGTRAFASLYNAIREGNISFTDINANMSDFSGNLEKTFDATLDPIDEFTTTMNELKILGAEIGEEVLPVLVDVLKDLKPILDDLKSAWESMSEEEQRQLIENLGKIALLAPALSGTGRIISGLGMGISTLAKAGSKLSSLGIGAKLSTIFGSGATAGAGATAGVSLGTALVAGFASALAGGAIGKALDNYVIAPILDTLGSSDAEWYRNFTWFGDGGFFDEMFDFNSLNEALETYKGAFALMGEDAKTNLNNMKAGLSVIWDSMSTEAKGAVGGMTTAIAENWDKVKTTATTTWDNIKTSIGNAIDYIQGIFTGFREGVFTTFTDIWDKIKEIWTNLGAMFEAGFDIKLPHISVSGGVAPYGIGGQGSLPKFDIDWYKDGGILTSPTIFGMQNGRFLGGGEAGAEAVLPLSNLEGMIAGAMTTALGNGGDTIINVSIDNNSLGSVILTAEQMMNLRRGR